MQLEAKLKMKLSSLKNKIILKYDTYEKTTYDYFLMTSAIKNFKRKSDVFKYIDEITGNGSLNLHFKKIYEKVKKLKDEQIERILNSSMYPSTVINERNEYIYYPDLNLTVFKDKTYVGDLKKNKTNIEMIKKALLPLNEDISFNSIEFDEKEEKVEKFCDVLFTKNEIKISLDNRKNYYQIFSDKFPELYTQNLDEIEKYKGNIGNEITPGIWYALDNSELNNLFDPKVNHFFNRENNHCTVYSEYIKITKVIKLFGIYFYNEAKYTFDEKDKEMSEDYLKYLEKSKKLNETKTIILNKVLRSVDIKKAKTIANQILSNKSSKDIALFALTLIKNGETSGWTLNSLKAIKQNISVLDYQYIYPINQDIFDLNDFINMPNGILSKKDRLLKEKYLSDKKHVQDEINKMIGEITSSGVREKMKKLPTKDAVYDKLNKFINTYIGHSRLDYSKLNLDELKLKYSEFKKIYENEFLNIKQRIEKYINKQNNLQKGDKNE